MDSDDIRSDSEVARAVQGGDIDAFGILVRRWEAPMRRYARRFLPDYDSIEIAVQDVFIRAYENINAYDARRPFSPWLYRVAHNHFVDVTRKEKRSPVSFIDLDTLLPVAVAEETADAETMKRELEGHLGNLLAKLDPKYREPIILFYLEELSYRDIADILKVPIGTVGVRVKRGRDRLRALSERDETL